MEDVECAICRTNIQGEIISLHNEFHLNCFKCSKCNTMPEIDPSKFIYNRDNKEIICSKCTGIEGDKQEKVIDVYYKAPLCPKCNLVISSGAVKAINQKEWHPACFACERCHKKLQKRFFILTNKSYCEKCCYVQKLEGENGTLKKVLGGEKIEVKVKKQQSMYNDDKEEEAW